MEILVAFTSEINTILMYITTVTQVITLLFTTTTLPKKIIQI